MATTNKGLNQPANNSYINTWDVPLNANFGYIDSSLGGVATLPANTDITSTPVTLTTTQYQNLILRITGSFTGTLRYNIPSDTGSIGGGVGGMWIVDNQTSGAGVITFGTTAVGGTTITCPQSTRTFIMSDGVNIRLASETQTGFLPELTFTNSISPTALTATPVNDWSPTGLSATSVIRIDASADATITGIAAQESGSVLILQNISTSYTVTLANANTGSSAANRFSFGSDYTIGTQGSIVVMYDSALTSWVIVANAQQTATQAQAIAGTDNSTVMTPLRVKEAIGSGYKYLNTQIITTAGSGTYTPTSGTKYIIVRGAGGGGGGGYARASGGTSSASASGGGGGAFDPDGISVDLTVGPITSIPYSIGAAGTGGIGSSSTAATAGGSTTFGSAGVYLNLGGGGAGTSVSSSSNSSSSGATGGTVTVGGTSASKGQPGLPGAGAGGYFSIGGGGGASPWGSGGLAGSGDASAGGNAGGHGAGGGGASARNSGSISGGAGTTGILIIEEYI